MPTRPAQPSLFSPSAPALEAPPPRCATARDVRRAQDLGRLYAAWLRQNPRGTRAGFKAWVAQVCEARHPLTELLDFSEDRIFRCHEALSTEAHLAGHTP